MKFELYTDVVLRCDLPRHRLKKGDIVKVVEHFDGIDRVEGYSIEAFNALGNDRGYDRSRDRAGAAARG